MSIDLRLSSLQQRMQWDMKSYSHEFLANKAQHRDFQHALLHLDKAMGKLSAMVEEAEHRDQLGEPFPKTAVAKYLADLVICAMRMASVNPSGPIDLELAVGLRVHEKGLIYKE